MTGPPLGVLEELDGARIGPRAAPPHALAWPHAMATGSRAALTRPRSWAFALVAFLARGGLAVLVVPMLILPTFIGLSNTVGPTSVTAAGPTPRLVALLAVWAAIGLAAIVGGTLVAAAAEVALHREMVAPGPDRAWTDVTSGLIASPTPTPRTATRRVAMLRLALLVPVGAALAAALPGWIQVAYNELLLPSDLAIPLPVRVVGGAPISTAVVIATWLVAEAVGGLAARHVALADSSVRHAVGAAARNVARAPLTVVLTTAISLAATVLVLWPAVYALSAVWEQARVALVNGTDGLQVIGTTLLLVAAWAGCLAVAGLAAAWRSAVWTAELARATRRP